MGEAPPVHHGRGATAEAGSGWLGFVRRTHTFPTSNRFIPAISITPFLHFLRGSDLRDMKVAPPCPVLAGDLDSPNGIARLRWD